MFQPMFLLHGRFFVISVDFTGTDEGIVGLSAARRSIAKATRGGRRRMNLATG